MFSGRRAAVGMLVAWGSLAACAGNPGPGAGVRLWLEGPVRWLLQPEEERAFRQAASDREAVALIEAFWERRDPTPQDADNPFRESFLERAEAADRLYAEPGRRGSLTDRGRALVLLGPPSILRYRQVAVPTLEVDPRRGSSQTRSRWMSQEIWVYRPEDLPPALGELLPEAAPDGELLLVFAVEEKRTYLLEGEKALSLAARAVAPEPPAAAEPG